MGSLVFQATLGGQVNLNGPNTASTFDIAVPATTGTMVTTGDSGTVTNTMLAASAYNTPGTIGSGTANTGAFTTLSASSTVSGTGFSTYLASPPAIGGTAAAAGTFTTLSGTTSVTTPIVKSASSLTLQTNGTTAAITLNTSGALGVGSSPSYGTSGQILTSAGSGAAPTWTSAASTTSISNGTSNVSIATSGGAVTVATNGTTALTLSTAQNATFVGTLATAAKGIAAASLPAGSVIQVVNASTSTNANQTTTTLIDTGLTATITPSSSSNKILVIVFQNGVAKNTQNTFEKITLNRGATLLYSLEGAVGLNGSTNPNYIGTVGTTYLDSPATTSATTYKTQFNNEGASGTTSVQINSATSTITLMEIAA